VYEHEDGLVVEAARSRRTSRASTRSAGARRLGEIVIEIEPGFLSYDSAFFAGALA